MTIEILCILLLSSPMLVELYNDRNGDHHPNNDWMLRGLLMLVSALIVFFIHPHKNFLQGLLLSFGIFLLFFPYLINIVHYQRKVIIDSRWWDHLSSTAIPDKWYWWSNTPWYGRFFIMAAIFAACVMLYTCWGKFFGFSNPCN